MGPVDYRIFLLLVGALVNAPTGSTLNDPLVCDFLDEPLNRWFDANYSRLGVTNIDIVVVAFV